MNEFKFSESDIITTDRYLEAFPDNYYKTDCIVYNQKMNWRGSIICPPTQNQSLIISGHSDYNITDNLVDYYNPGIWWCVNKSTLNKKVHSLPLGITNNTNESHLHRIYGNLECMIKVMNEKKEKVNLIYMNFNIETFPSERSVVYNLFQDKRWDGLVTKGIIENSLEGRIRFLREIRNHSFVLCPRGGGIDTHRLWETLYMDSIPIVKRDVAYRDFEELDLPICFIDNWEDITAEFLKNEKERIESGKERKEYNMEPLKISYWINKIKLI